MFISKLLIDRLEAKKEERTLNHHCFHILDMDFSQKNYILNEHPMKRDAS